MIDGPTSATPRGVTVLTDQRIPCSSAHSSTFPMRSPQAHSLPGLARTTTPSLVASAALQRLPTTT